MTTNNKTNTEGENRYAHCCQVCNGDFKSGLRHCRNYLCSCHTNTERTVDEVPLVTRFATRLASSGLFEGKGEILQQHINWLADELTAERQRAEGAVKEVYESISNMAVASSAEFKAGYDCAISDALERTKAIATRNDINL